MIPDQAKDEFWNVVEDCLDEIHGIPRPQAQRSSESLRKLIESKKSDAPTGPPIDIFYHNEPFDVSCDIAKNDIPLKHNRAKYDKILQRQKYDKILQRHKW